MEQVINELGYQEIKNQFNITHQEIDLNTLTDEHSTIKVFTKFYLLESSDNFIPQNFKISQLFQDEFKTTLKLFISRFDGPHTSSYVYLKSFVDIKKFISYQKKMTFYAIYLLAQKIYKEWNEQIDENTVFVCQSLNSSYLVSILSSLLKLDILILDKIGPVNKLYNKLDKNISGDKKYIVVSDMVCLGTEVKIVKNLIEFVGGYYIGNVALIKTETLKRSDIKRKDSTLAFFSIDKSNNKELDFFITTELEIENE